MKAPKPLYGTPCNGCGLCCLMEQCPLSVMLFGVHERCPALMDAGDRFACGLIAEPHVHFREEVAVEASLMAGDMLGIGTHCDSIASDANRAAEART